MFSFPPDKGNVGTAAYLNVFGSIFRVLQDLQADGYDVGQLPADERELMERVSSCCPVNVQQEAMLKDAQHCQVGLVDCERGTLFLAGQDFMLCHALWALSLPDYLVQGSLIYDCMAGLLRFKPHCSAHSI